MKTTTSSTGRLKRVMTPTELEMAKILEENFFGHVPYVLWCVLACCILRNINCTTYFYTKERYVSGLSDITLMLFLITCSGCLVNLYLWTLLEMGSPNGVRKWCRSKMLLWFLMLYHPSRSAAKQLLERIKQDQDIL